MSLGIGIIGLPNVGKSSTFNALCKAMHAEVANYPFCTIQPNRAIVAVPDERVEKLVELVNVGKTVHATVEFVDIAGLVKGASQGEGLGNQFLANIRETAALLHIVRCFEDVNVAHSNEVIDPIQDIEIVNLELIMADLQTIERKIERLSGAIKSDKKILPYIQTAQALKEHLTAGKPLSLYAERSRDAFLELDHELRFLTNKPQIYVANVDEDGLGEDNEYVSSVKVVGEQNQVQVVKLCAKLEQELIDLPDEEREEYLQLAGVKQSGLEQVIRGSYALLELISFFTMNEEEVRAWTIRHGWTASKAAGVIHTDFERGFIRAEVIPYTVFEKYGNSAAVRLAGQMRIEGKDYVVQDGDVIYFRFNV